MKQYKKNFYLKAQQDGFVEGYEKGKKEGYSEGYMQSERDRVKDLQQKLNNMPYEYFENAKLMEDRIWNDEINPHTESSKKLEKQLLEKQ